MFWDPAACAIVLLLAGTVLGEVVEVEIVDGCFETSFNVKWKGIELLACVCSDSLYQQYKGT